MSKTLVNWEHLFFCSCWSTIWSTILLVNFGTDWKMCLGFGDLTPSKLLVLGLSSKPPLMCLLALVPYLSFLAFLPVVTGAFSLAFSEGLWLSFDCESLPSSSEAFFVSFFLVVYTFGFSMSSKLARFDFKWISGSFISGGSSAKSFSSNS